MRVELIGFSGYSTASWGIGIDIFELICIPLRLLSDLKTQDLDQGT